MSEDSTALAQLSQLSLAKINDPNEVRKLWVLSAGLTTTLSKIYNSIRKDAKSTKEDRDNALLQASSASKINLRAEARLGELIREGQEAGRIAKQGIDKDDKFKGSTVATLKDIGLTKTDSSRAQRVADNQDLIEETEQEELIKGNLFTRRDILKKAKKRKQSKTEETQNNKRKTLSTQANIKNVDYRKILKEINPLTIDLLITDPPYMTEIPDIDTFTNEWVDKVLSTVKDTGQAYIFTGAYFEELRAYISKLSTGEGLRFKPQVLVWEYRNTIGPAPKTHYKQNWQAIFYLRGKDAPDINTDRLTELFTVQQFNAPDARHETRYHLFEKPIELAKQLIRHSTKEGDKIFDPFAGTGTFLLAAAELGRENIGSEIDQEMIKIAEKRGCILK